MATETPDTVVVSVVTPEEDNVPISEKINLDDLAQAKGQQSDSHPNTQIQVKQSASKFSRLRTHLSSPIRVDLFAEIELLIVTFCTGIQDVTTFPDYHCFASNQTGKLAISCPQDTRSRLIRTKRKYRHARNGRHPT